MENNVNEFCILEVLWNYQFSFHPKKVVVEFSPTMTLIDVSEVDNFRRGKIN